MARYNYYNSYTQYLQPPPLQLCFFFLVLFFFLSFSWYVNYESAFEDMMDQMKLILMICPVFLLLLVQWLSSSTGNDGRQRIPSLNILPTEQDSIHRAGGSPWGVGLLLIFLIVMVSYQSSIKESWFPLFSR